MTCPITADRDEWRAGFACKTHAEMPAYMAQVATRLAGYMSAKFVCKECGQPFARAHTAAEAERPDA